MSTATNEKTYSLAEAALLCGMSLNRFRSHKEELVEHGAIVSSTGWLIPHEAISADGLNWIGKKPARQRAKTVPARAMSDAQKEIAALRAQVKELEA